MSYYLKLRGYCFMIKCRSIKTILSVIALSALFFSCKNQLSQTSDNIDNKKNDSILYELKGKIHFDYSDYKSSENQITPSSRAAIAIPESLSCTVTAREAEVSSTTPAVWSVKTGGRTFTTETDSANNFIIKLPAGNWLLSAASEYFSTPTDCVAQVEINPATNTLAYVTNIEIIVKSKITVANGGNSGGTVNLTLSDDTGTIKTVRASRVVSGTIDVIQIMSETSTNSKTFVFTWGEPTGSPAQNPEVASGVYDVTFDFYTEEASTIESVPETLPVYSFNDYINVFDEAETNTWLLDSNSSVYGGLAPGATAGSEGELVPSVFKITQTALDNYKKYVYFVSTPAEVKAAVQKILAINDANTETNLQNRPEFQLILTDNITYPSGSEASTFTNTIEDPVIAANISCCHAIYLNPTKPLKLTVCGKQNTGDYIGSDKLYTLDFSSLNTSYEPCGIFANYNTRLTLSNIEIKGAKIGVWRDCEESGGSWVASFITLKNRVIIKDNNQNLKFTKTNPTATQAQSDTSIPAAPIIIDSTFSPQSRIGLMFGDKDIDGTKETPCAVTTGFSERFSSSSGIVPKDIFFSDRGYNIILEDDAVSWNNEGGTGYIYSDMIPKVYFEAIGNTQNQSSTYGGAKYDIYNERFLISYKDSSAYIYVIPKLGSIDSSYLLFTDPDFNPTDFTFTLKLVYENGDEVSGGNAASNPTWETAPYTEEIIDQETGESSEVQTGLKFSISGTDNTVPTGRYKLVATAKYNGNQYTECWDLSCVKVIFSVDNNFVRINSGGSSTVKLKLSLDEGSLKDVTSSSTISGYRKRITGLNEDGGFSTTDSSSISSFEVSIPANSSLYLLEGNVNYKGLKCYTDTGSTTQFETLIAADEKESFYFTPGCSMQTSINDDDLQAIIDSIRDSDFDDCNIYLMGNAVATEETMQETIYYLTDSTWDVTDEGHSFININAYTDATPINMRITSYGSTIYSINAAGTPYAAGSSENVLSSDKQGRVLYIGRNASVTFEKVQIKGGYAHKGTALLVSKGSSVNLINTYVGDTSTNIIGYCAATNSFENISSPNNGNPGSLIYIDSSNTEGESSTFICKDTIFNRNMGMIYIGSGTNLSISGTISSTDSNVSSTMFFSNSVSGNANFIDIDGNLQPGSSIKGVVFYKNWFINASDSAQADKPISIIKTSSNNLLLQNIKMYNNASSFSNAHFYSSGVFCTSNNSTGSVDLKDCHFYSNNQSINSSTDSASDFVAVCLRGGTANITDCTFTELSESNNYAIYTGVTGTNNPASPLTNRINLSGTIYTDGVIYLCKPYISSGGSVIGIRMFVDSTLTLPDADYLTEISGNTYATDPTTFGTIILHYDSATPASAYKAYSQVLEGTLQDVRACRNKFTVKLDDTNGTEKSLNERGQVEW